MSTRLPKITRITKDYWIISAKDSKIISGIPRLLVGFQDYKLDYWIIIEKGVAKVLNTPHS